MIWIYEDSEMWQEQSHIEWLCASFFFVCVSRSYDCRRYCSTVRLIVIIGVIKVEVEWQVFAGISSDSMFCKCWMQVEKKELDFFCCCVPFQVTVRHKAIFRLNLHHTIAAICYCCIFYLVTLRRLFTICYGLTHPHALPYLYTFVLNIFNLKMATVYTGKKE